MQITYWIVAGVVAAAFLFAGTFKIVTPKEKLKASGMNWTDLYSQSAVRGIGTAEVLGAIGVIVPPLTGIAEWLAPVAAVGLDIVMVGAIRAHRKLGEPVIVNVILGLLALAAAVLGFLVWV